jgi:hypothetical protein
MATDSELLERVARSNHIDIRLDWPGADRKSQGAADA